VTPFFLANLRYITNNIIMLLNNGQRQGVLPSKGQQVKQLTLRCGELERERDAARHQIEQLKMMLAHRQVAINALGTHYSLTPEAMKEIVEKFMEEQEKIYLAQTEEAKKKYMEGIRNGTAPDLKFVSRDPNAPAEPPVAAPDTPAVPPVSNVEEFPKQ
jgi:predicted DNA-binding protein